MRALIMILHNLANGTYHPIWYTEKFFPGPGPNPMIRYKSKGHHTNGFPSFEEATSSANDELKPIVEDQGYQVVMETEGVLEWNGEGIPADTQLRPA